MVNLNSDSLYMEVSVLLKEQSNDKKDKKKKLLMEAAVKVMSNKGYNNSSISDITKEAHVSVGTFYSYFKNKEDILEYIYDEISEIYFNISKMYLINTKESTAIKITKVISSIIFSYHKYQKLTQILLKGSFCINENFQKRYFDILDRTKNTIVVILKKMNLDNELDMVDIDIIAMTIVKSIHGVLEYWIYNNEGKDILKVTYSIVIYNLNALKLDFDCNEIKIQVEKLLKEETCKD